MSPTPVTFTSSSQPSSYTWEATDEEVSARYGIPLDQVARFDLNTSPAPPELAVRLLASHAFDRSISEYPPSDYRRLSVAAAARYGVESEEVLVGAGADEILDLIAKAFLPPGGSAVIPTPSYAMYGVETAQRGATVRAVPRLGPSARFAMDVDEVRAAARKADVVWLCSPNNPTALPEPDGAIEALLAGLLSDARTSGAGQGSGPAAGLAPVAPPGAATASSSGRETASIPGNEIAPTPPSTHNGRMPEPPIVVLDEAYAEFVGRSLVSLRASYPRLIVIRTASKAYALAGLRVGFALARPEIISRLAPFRPPGSVAVPSVHIVTEALLDDGILTLNLDRVERERARLTVALQDAGWSVGPSVTNFVLVDLGSAARAAGVAEELLRRGLVPRTFGPTHPLAHCLRITVRSEPENDRLIAAAREISLGDLE
ncbi:MAG: histidinol-phosphate aminotransferase family protein [Chloroflexi bacterium]|nr:histidinol-phosphate aminotransferase family protein [Chloroflexota bacterium]